MAKKVPLRKTLEEKGYNVSYDADTGRVNVGEDSHVTEQGLEKLGERRDGRWHIPEDEMQEYTDRLDPPDDKPTDESDYEDTADDKPTDESDYEDTADDKPTDESDYEDTADDATEPPTVDYESEMDSEAELEQLNQMIQQQGEAFLEQQLAEIDSLKEQELMELQNAYNRAVEDGQISIREAERQYEERRNQIEQSSYEDSQQTALMAQEMGIQHSPQMVGMMQGDQARQRALTDEAKADKQQRINNVRDRLDRIRKEKELDVAQTRSQAGHQARQAMGEAQQMQSQQMYDLAHQDFQTRQEHDLQQQLQQQQQQHQLTRDAFQHDLQAERDEKLHKQDRRMAQLQHVFNLDIMDEEQQHDLEVLSEQHQNALEQATHNTRLDIQRMEAGHDMDLEKMQQQFQQDLTKMAEQFGYDKQLQSQRGQQKLSELANRFQHESEMFEKELEAQEERFEKELEAEQEMNEAEREFQLEQMEEEKQDAFAEFFEEKVFEGHMEAFYGEDSLVDPGYTADDLPGEPSQFDSNLHEALGTFYGGAGESIAEFFTGTEETQKEKEAIKRFLENRQEFEEHYDLEYPLR